MNKQICSRCGNECSVIPIYNGPSYGVSSCCSASTYQLTSSGVNIIYCRDCSRRGDIAKCILMMAGRYINDNDYCSYAEVIV